MKQTITILTALMTVLVMISGFIVLGSMQQSETLAQKEEQLLQRTREVAQRNEQILALETAAKTNQETIQQLTKERDALSQQLSDAVLSSQESNDAIAHQAEAAEALQMENERLKARIGALEDEASLAALAWEQQAKEDAQKLQALQQELEEALMPAATPSPLRVERRVNLKKN